jgi:hypothetical protein
MSDDPPPPPRVWHHSTPEGRLSVATYRFLRRALVPPHYVVAIPDSDHGTRSDLQRIRDAAKGQVSGQLDMDVVQYPGLARKVELKRGRNKPTAHQLKTIADLTACGAPPIVAWSLQDVHVGLLKAGFRFLPYTGVTLVHMQALLDGWDREAALLKSGEVVRKRRPARRPVSPRPGLTWLKPP